MSQAVFPAMPGLKWGVRRSPFWSTSRKTAVSGREYRAANMIYPRYRYRLTYEFLRDLRAGVDELRTLVGFFNSRRGSFDSFLFADLDDATASGENFGLGNGSTTQFQLVRTFGGFVEPVYDLNGAPQIYKEGVLQTVTTHYTIGSTGVVTFVTAPANGQALTWTGSYYWRCCFERDSADFEKFLKDLWDLKQCDLITVLP